MLDSVYHMILNLFLIRTDVVNIYVYSQTLGKAYKYILKCITNIKCTKYENRDFFTGYIFPKSITANYHIHFLILFSLILYIPVSNFLVLSGWTFLA